MTEEDAIIIQTVLGSLGSQNPRELLKLLDGARMDFNATFEDIPLEIGLRFRGKDLLIRVRVIEEEEENGQSTQSNQEMESNQERT